jgi:Exocyst complex component Sec6
LEPLVRAFLDLATQAKNKLVEDVLNDPALVDVFKKLYMTSSWKQGEVTETILATLAGYLADCQATLEANVFKRTVEGILDDCVNKYTQALLHPKKKLTHYD